ncbi:serine O-acetyltransferase EpsC [Methylomonas fluvii]|uniref:serine O-acetyltransferase n=1 Tax=Methylomonas fluvii TaxID=1854564 RepID=A0ABR9DKX0_9GAMM|nr:serine O-acetyltransferase EpsC [Methylomonas fluvii]MBD9362978.1 serine acetyltransferase [Methylomonas fluvii]CAD6876164.1 Serine acetyltransferase (EC 2.3.1.30) [Methylomonas fluvii]
MTSSEHGQRWEIDALVAKLRELRLQSLESRQRREHPPKLPSRKVLSQIVDNLGAALFPNRLGMPDLTDEGIDYFVGHTLDSLLRQLQRQIGLELQFVAEQQGLSLDTYSQATEITRQFAAQLPAVRQLIDTDIQAAYEGDPAARCADEVLVCYPGITAVIHHRLAHVLYELGLPLVARVISEVAHSATGIDIHPGAQIGESFFIDHGTGVVIGETAVIGRRVRLYQAVTLGAKRFDKDDNGILVKGNARHPIVEDDVVIYAGATILGRITIGRGSTIGGNVWLTHSVPPDSLVSQGQNRTEVFAGGGGI